MSDHIALLDMLVALVTSKVSGKKDPALPYVGLEHIESGSPRLVGTADSSSSISTNTIFDAGDVLFGKLRPNLRKSVQVDFRGYCSTDLLVLRTVSGNSPAFAARLVQSDAVFRRAELTEMGTKMPRTSWSEIRSTPIRIPPLPEQRAIAAVLDAIDDSIRKTEQIIAKLQQVKQGLLHDLLTRGIDDNGELRDPDRHPEQFQDSPLGRIPKGWEVVALAKAADLIDGDRGNEYPNESDFSSDGHCLFLSAKNVTKEGFRFDVSVFINRGKDEALGNGRLERSDIVVTTRGTLGNFAYYDISVPFNVLRINSGMVIIRVREEYISTKFLYVQLSSMRIARQIELSAYGSAQPQLNLDILRRLLVLKPIRVEQVHLVDRIEGFEHRVHIETAKLSKLRLLKSGLAEDLLTGRVRTTALGEIRA